MEKSGKFSLQTGITVNVINELVVVIADKAVGVLFYLLAATLFMSLTVIKPVYF